MTLNFPKSIYTAAEATTASISPANASPSDGDTGTIGSHGFTFDDDRVDSNGRWVMNSGVTYSLTSGATYTWDLYKWKASNIPDSSTAVQTTDTPSSGEVLKWNGSAAVWDSDNNTTYSAVTTSADGLMLSTDKSKLDNIASNANNYQLPTADASTVGGFKVVDEDDMASDLADSVPTQQSVKKYVDDEIAGVSSGGIASVSADTSPQLGGDLDLNSNDITGTGNISTTGNLTLTKTSASGPSLKLNTNATLADNNLIGSVAFWGNTDNTNVELCKIYNRITDVTHSTADATMFFSVMNDGGSQLRMGIVGGGYSEFYNTDVCLSNVGLKFTGSTTNNSLYTTLTVVNPTQNNTITFPDNTGTVLLDSTRLLVGKTEATEDITVSSSPQTLDFTEHGLHKWDIDSTAGTVGVQTTSWSSSTEVQSTTLMVRCHSSSAINLPTTVWIGGSAPSISSTNFSVIEFWMVNSTLYGAYVGDVS